MMWVCVGVLAVLVFSCAGSCRANQTPLQGLLTARCGCLWLSVGLTVLVCILQALIWDLSPLSQQAGSAGAAAAGAAAGGGAGAGGGAAAADMPAAGGASAITLDPILAYSGGAEINQLQWSIAQPDWLAVSFANKTQILRV